MIRQLVHASLPLIWVATAHAAPPTCKTGAACFEEGNKLVNARNEAAAGPVLEQGCKLGSQEACNLLAVLLVDGRGVKQDALRAHQLWVAACDQGEPFSCTSLALEAVDADPPRAIAYYKRGCKAGNPRACRGAGKVLDETGTESDEPAVKELLDLACKAKDILACDYAKDLADRLHPVQRVHVQTFHIDYLGMPFYKNGKRTKAQAEKLAAKLAKTLDAGGDFDEAAKAAGDDRPDDQTLVRKTHESPLMVKLFELAPKHAAVTPNPSFGFVLWYRD